ncbi:amine oxidase [Gemmatimonadetes bacterium T265]|nr:amine oxidase [Gemmatimonadetes bacterium T265]
MPASAAHTLPIAVVGAGIGGLVAARALRRRGLPVAVFEAGRRVAGMATSFQDPDGFTYDFGAHFITNRLAAALGVGDRCRDVRHYGETVFVRGRSYGYPFGLLRAPRYVASAAAARADPRTRAAGAASAADWYRATYGRAVADEIAIPLVEAWSGASADDLAPSVIAPQLERGIAHVARLKLASRVFGRAVANGYSREMPERAHVWHVYPDGGVAVLCDAIARELPDAVHLESPVEAIYVDDGRAAGVRVGGRDVGVRAVVSTAPVHVLAKLVRGTDAFAHLARFRYRPMTFVNLRFEGRGLLPDVVTWTPESRFPFFRLTEAPTSMPWLAPAGMTMITADIGCEVGDATWTAPDDALGDQCVEALLPIVPDARRRYRGCRVLRTPVAYPVFLRAYEADRVAHARDAAVRGLYNVGRNAEFSHILMEDIYWRTLAKMHALAAAHGPHARPDPRTPT